MRRRPPTARLATIAAVVLCLGASSAVAAAPPPLAKTPEDGQPGEVAGRIDLPRGIAADQSLPGHVYAVDAENGRIAEFTAWGDFVKAWGWGVLNGEAKLQSCTVETGCLKGLEGAGAGQFDTAEAIAVDGDGDVYAIEAKNHRVQKFDPTGGPGEDEAELLLAFGEAGAGPGQFDGGFASYLNQIAASSVDNAIFVAEGGRIQRFSSAGVFEGEIKEGCLAGKKVGALAAGPDGSLYAAIEGAAEVLKLKPNGPTAQCLTSPYTPEVPAERPTALAVDGNGNLYVVLNRIVPPNEEPERVQKYDPSGKCLTCGKEGEGGKPGFDRSPDSELRSVAATSACKADDAYVAHFTSTTPPQSYFNVFGAPPDSGLCPQPLRPPEVKAQYALSVETDAAELRADINPRFWDDTTYHVEYGASPCGGGGCASTADVTLAKETIGSAIAGPSVFLEGLEPGTTYHYRFVAQSSGGGPVYGADATFTTFRTPAAQSCPANEAFRTGASALLPDCRAYELVSPLDKASGDVVVLGETREGQPAVLSQSAISGDRLAYGSYRSFSGAESAPYTTQYLASRQPGKEWVSHPISPPRGKGIYDLLLQTDTEFKAFSPDLCEGWLQTVAEMPLVTGAPDGVSDLFRRSDEECGGPAYEPLNTTVPPSQTGGNFAIELQGLSEDGSVAAFMANDALAEGASEGTFQAYAVEGGVERFLCVLPSGAAYSDTCSVGGRAGVVTGFGNREGNLNGALSANGQRVYWAAFTGSFGGSGKIYLRENPFEDQSAQSLGSASGTGKLTAGSTSIASLIAAQGKASFEAGSATVALLETSVGRFVAGQPVSAGKTLPAGTTILGCSPECGAGATSLTLSANAGETIEKGIASIGPMPFAVGQTIRAQGIPAGTTIVEAKAGTLTLSKAATKTQSGTPLDASSECTEAAKACTIPVSEVAEADAGTSGSLFQVAAKDGSAVLLSTADGLYEFRLADRSTHPIAGGFEGLLGASEDLSRIYLASKEALGGPNAEGKAAAVGEKNLYLYEGGSFRYIGEVVSEGPTFGPLSSAPRHHTARVSPDGLHAAFKSVVPMTGYDNTDQATGKADAEAFLYNAAADGGVGKLLCVSCNPSGARPHGGFDQGGPTAAQIPSFENGFYAARVLSDDGSRLFFESFDALTPRDSNGRKDVYQWEAPGAGGCGVESPSFSPLNGGCVDLISSGESKLDSTFVDASPSGDDVFFATLSSLVPQDYGLTDVYDARVGGGLPVPPPPAPECEGETCQHPPAAPRLQGSATSTYQGPGNLEAAKPRPRCPKGRRQVRKGGKRRCVRGSKTTRQKRHNRRSRNR